MTPPSRENLAGWGPMGRPSLPPPTHETAPAKAASTLDRLPGLAPCSTNSIAAKARAPRHRSTTIFPVDRLPLTFPHLSRWQPVLDLGDYGTTETDYSTPRMQGATPGWCRNPSVPCAELALPIDATRFAPEIVAAAVEDSRRRRGCVSTRAAVSPLAPRRYPHEPEVCTGLYRIRVSRTA